MTATLQPNAPPEAAQTPSRWRRGRRKPNPAGAIVARGEPLVWLSGSALVVTLMMIVGLTLLILCIGASTFWPRPLVRLQLKDGTTVLGEISATEQYQPQLKTAEERSGNSENSTDRAPQERRQVRIGNYELTGAHYRWINDSDIAAEGETTPEWAVMIERLEQGQFYGIPKRIVLHHLRTVTGDEEQLARMVSFFELNAARLPEELAKGVEDPLASLRRQLQTLQETSTDTLLEQHPVSATGASLEAELPDGSVLSVAELAKNSSVRELRESIVDAEQIWDQFQQHHQVAMSLRRKKLQIQKQQIGDASRMEEQARQTMKSIGMRLGLDLEFLANERRAIDDQLLAFEGVWNEQQQFHHLAQRRFGVDSKLSHAVMEILKTLKSEYDAQRVEPDEQIRRWEARVKTLPSEANQAVAEFLKTQKTCATEIAAAQAEINRLDQESRNAELELETASGETKSLWPDEIVRAVPANRLSTWESLKVYGSRWREFLLDDPREANTEGGVFPAIWGTVTMTLIMSIAVVPFGVLAALYLREYAKAGFIVSAVRIAVNNLAGVPSIVFGVFGLGFFCYIFGAYVDGGPKNAGFTPWTSRAWMTQATILAGTSFVAFLLGLYSLTSRKAEASRLKQWMGRGSIALWLASFGLLIALFAHIPYFDGFYSVNLPNPTFGKGGVLWAALTLALMTLPVVIVATEEALAAVPNSMREGSYACGASKWQTIVRIVLPRALPGIMTGMILAMARGAGEVAPLMLVGAVKNVPELPLDLEFPFLHPDRSFMHLGFHIYDLGFQSPNSEAAKPMVFTTTLLLISLIAALNLVAIWLRARLRQRYKSAQF